MKITLERAMEAWLASNGSRVDMLIHLSQRPGIKRTSWYRTKNDGVCRYICNVCDQLICTKPIGRGGKRAQTVKHLSAHVQIHLDQLDALLRVGRNE